MMIHVDTLNLKRELGTLELSGTCVLKSLLILYFGYSIYTCTSQKWNLYTRPSLHSIYIHCKNTSTITITVYIYSRGSS